MDKKYFEQHAGILKAMSHASRLIIINELSKEDKCVCELQKIIGSDMSTVSKHLSVLKNAGIITSEKKGLMVIYHLEIPCILEFLSCSQKVINANKNR